MASARSVPFFVKTSSSRPPGAGLRNLCSPPAPSRSCPSTQRWKARLSAVLLDVGVQERPHRGNQRDSPGPDRCRVARVALQQGGERPCQGFGRGRRRSPAAVSPGPLSQPSVFPATACGDALIAPPQQAAPFLKEAQEQRATARLQGALPYPKDCGVCLLMEMAGTPRPSRNSGGPEPHRPLPDRSAQQGSISAATPCTLR